MDFLASVGLRGIARREKEWGLEVWMVNNELYCAKYLFVHPASQCSLHRHLSKDETFVVLAGELDLELGDDIHHLKTTDSIRIPAGTWHRFRNTDNGRWGIATILEVSTHHDDADVERREPSRGNEMYRRMNASMKELSL